MSNYVGIQPIFGAYNPGSVFNITSGMPFRNPPSTDFHDGIDFAAPVGTAVFNAADGVVTAVRTDSNGFGMLSM